MKNLSICHLLLLSAFLLMPSCAVNPVTGKKQLMFMSEGREIEMGRQYDPQVISAFGEYKNEELLTFLQKMTNEMGAISHRPKLEYHIRILDTPVINAFAVPGGYIYMTRGILAQFNNEAELAGVVAHEMGHITARHSVNQQSKQQLAQMIFIGGMIASEELRNYAEYALQGMQLLFFKFSRDHEVEADRLGVEYASKISYDAKKMADFYQVLVKMNLASEHGGIPTFMSTHPDPGDRYNSVKKDAEEWQSKLQLPVWKVNADSYLKMIDGIVYGEDPRQGFVEAGTFYHPELKFKFSFPSGWLLDNSPMQVRMAPQDGKALMIFTFAQGNTLEEAAKNSIEQLQLTLQESKNTTVNGMPALATLSKQISQDQSTGQTQSIMVMSYFIHYGNIIYVFHGVSGEADFNAYFGQFESTMVNFSVLTDPSKLNVTPKRIVVKQVQRSGTLADVFRNFGVQQALMADFAFLNIMELTDIVPAGKLIKIVE